MTDKKHIQFHDELNPKLWDGDKLKPEVKIALSRVSTEFVAFLKIKVVPSDVIIVGSSVNYNYTDYSDVDLHIVINFGEIDDDKEFVKEYFNSKKFIWNSEHDIKVYGHEIECYVQDIDEIVKSSAVFSLKQDKWIRKAAPNKPEVDIEAVKQKVKDFADRIELAKADKDALTDLKDKLKNMRKSGLETAGEYSTENLAFKVLRNSGEIGKLIGYARKSYDNQLSLNEWEDLLS